jgi:NADH-quinone oxidoreductase subunit C
MDFKNEIIEKLSASFPSSVISHDEFRDELSLNIERARLLDVLKFLKEDESLKFEMCEDVTAIDQARKKNRFTAVYHIYSFKHNFRLRIKTDVDDATCSVDSVTPVYKSAEWYERETYDMFGIKFTNHPDLRRMYMPEEFEYHPLRKEFPVMGIPGSLSLPKK